jgi:hypothetical protein
MIYYLSHYCSGLFQILFLLFWYFYYKSHWAQ